MENLTYEQWLESLTAADAELLRRGIRTMMSRTFIVKADDRGLFRFFSRNREILDKYFSAAGYSLRVDEDYGICMLRDRMEEKPEIASINRKNFRVRDSVIYCCLAWIFIGKMNAGMDRAVVISPAELTHALEQFDIGAGFRTAYSLMQIRESLKVLEQYSLVAVNGELGEPDCALVLYPSLLFGLSVEEMKKILEEHGETYRSYYGGPGRRRRKSGSVEDAEDTGEEDPDDAENGDFDGEETE